jgi:thiamine biosynthesis protein ThiC
MDEEKKITWMENMMTQLDSARKGTITKEMGFIAKEEGVSPLFVLNGVKICNRS